eukprot:XP_011663703.1 PREDICTED: uncharacterized protein LOC105438068 [Strongylocentrotus purpuratus]
MVSGRLVEDLTNCYRSAVDEYSQRRARVGGLQICSLHSAVASPTDNTPCQRVSIWQKTLMTIMERQLKGGRKAHGHNGRNTQSCKLTSKRIEEDSFDEVLQSKPNGSCKMEGCNKTGQKSELNICTYNVRTLRTEESLESLLDELEGFKWDVIGLAETKRQGEGLTELKGGTWLYNRGKTDDDKNAKGIGFLIHNKFKDYVKGVKSYSNRVAAMKIQLTGKDEMCIIQVYAPTSDYDDITVEEFYEDINKAITDNSGTYTVLMGDFNAKIGQREKGEENIMGSFSYGERNRRGERMIEFAMEHKLKVTNTYFKKHKSRYWTWESPNGVTKNQIDFILSNQRGIIKNCEVITNVDIASDHRMVRVNISINKKLARLRFIQNKRKTRINIMKLKGKKEEFQLKLHNRFDGLELEDMDIDERCDMMTSAMLEEAKSVAPTEKRKIIFTKVIQNRIKDRLDSNQPREQAGFRAGFSTTDHLQAINQLIEKANEYQLQLCLGFVDYQKAFDSIEHTDMFDALRKINIEEGYVRILEDIYTNAVARIHIDNDVSKEVKIQRGVRQGDTLSPKIFTATIEEVFKKSHLNGGINIDGETLTDLRFADDVALISTSTKDLEDQLTGLNRES